MNAYNKELELGARRCVHDMQVTQLDIGASRHTKEGEQTNAFDSSTVDYAARMVPSNDSDLSTHDQKIHSFPNHMRIRGGTTETIEPDNEQSQELFSLRNVRLSNHSEKRT
jgi:hypothetical protein